MDTTATEKKPKVKKWRCLACGHKTSIRKSKCHYCDEKRGFVPPTVAADMRDKIKKLLSSSDGDHPRQRVPLDSCEPNPWNPNKMSQEKKDKLWMGMQNVLKQAGHLPAIWVRPHPSPHGKVKWQIIDGEQRWTILSHHQDSDIVQEHLLGEIDVEIYYVDTKTAMTLTSTGNWLRGEQDPDSYAEYLKSLLRDHHMTIEEAAQVLPETADEIQSYVEAYDIRLEDPDVPTGDHPPSDSTEGDDETLMEFKCVMRKGALRIVVQEQNRIAAMLKERSGRTGLNIQGRALEYMAVLSAQTPPESISGLMEDQDEPEEKDPDEEEKPKKTKGKKTKDKLREKAGRLA